MAREKTVGNREEFEVQDQAGFVNPENQQVPAGAPQPMLWKVLIMPIQPASFSKGTHGTRIALPEQSKDADSYLNYIGRVAAVGPLAGKSSRYENPDYKYQGTPTCEQRYLWDIKPGDWVCYGRYAGQRIEYQGVKFILANDDEILAKIDGPEGFRAYV